MNIQIDLLLEFVKLTLYSLFLAIIIDFIFFSDNFMTALLFSTIIILMSFLSIAILILTHNIILFISIILLIILILRELNKSLVKKR